MLSSKRPGATLANEKWPSGSVRVSAAGVVASRLSLTWAPETGAPVASSTVPLMLPIARESCGCPLVDVVASVERPCGSLATAAEAALSACANKGEELSSRPQIIPAPSKVTRKKRFGFLCHTHGPICPLFPHQSSTYTEPRLFPKVSRFSQD